MRSSAAGAWQFELRLERTGYLGAMRPVERAVLHASGTRIEYRRGDIVEWYQNGPAGLEQGFTLHTPPPRVGQDERCGAGALCVEMAVAGDFVPTLSDGVDSIVFHHESSDALLTYDKLVAFDASGRVLPSRMAIEGGRIVLCVDDEGGDYPVTIDPTFWVQEAKLTAADAGENDTFGYSVALSGNTALVSSLTDTDEIGNLIGSAYVFVRSGVTWTQQAKLLCPDPPPNGNFGWAVGLSGDTAVVTAHVAPIGGMFSVGAAYVFVRSGTTWSFQAKLTALDGLEQDAMGYSVAISGDTVVTGAFGDHVDGVERSGSAYVFVRTGTTWAQQARLSASDKAAFDGFGSSVAIDGNTAVVGAQGNDHSGHDSPGAAYVYVRSGTVWSEQAKLMASDPTGFANYGISVAVSGETALVGATFGINDDGIDSGNAYVHVRSGVTWTQQAKLKGPDVTSFNLFGFAVALSGNTAVVGAFGQDNGGGVDAGAAYVFARSGSIWRPHLKVKAPDAAEFDFFGAAVAISGDTVLASSQGAELPGIPNAGAAYVFRPITCCAGDTNASGQVTLDDVPGFVQVLLTESGTANAQCGADVNDDAVINGEDVQAMVDKLLAGGGCP